MLIEQINEFGLRGLGSLVVLVLLQLVIFVKKEKILTKSLSVDYYLLLKYCRSNVPYFPYLGQITKFNLKMQGFKHVLDLNCT